MKPADRIDKLLRYLDLKPAEFAKELDYDRPETIYRVIHGRSKAISNDLAHRIVTRYPQINRTFLITGLGDMLLNEPPEIVNDHKPVYNPSPSMLEVLREQLAEKDKQIDQLQNRIKEMIDYLKKREEQERQK